MAQLFHVLFLATPVVAIVLAIAGQWPAAIGVFLIGTPLFWLLRNRSLVAVSQHDPLSRQLRSEPSRYEVPPAVRSDLSARNLDDVPAQVRSGSPGDADDAVVLDTLRKLGVMHPQTNYGVVYRCCFAPYLEAGEVPKFLRFSVASLGVAPTGSSPKMGESEQAWVLVTDRGIYWHQLSDHVPRMPPRNPMEGLLAPTRWFVWKVGVTGGTGPSQPGAGGIPMRPLTIESVEDGSVWCVKFGLPTDPQTDALIDYVQTRISGT